MLTLSFPARHRLKLTALLAAMLAACGGGSNDNDNDTAPRAGSSAECISPEGQHYTARYRFSNSDGSTGTELREVNHDQPATFNGQAMMMYTSVRQYIHNTDPNAGRSFGGALVSYYTQDGPAAPEVLYGWATLETPWEQLDQIRSSTLYTYSPAVSNNQWNLLPGQSQTLHYTGTAQTQAQGQPARNEVLDLTQTMTYEGQEEVDTPAGRFTACKFMANYLDAPNGFTWYAKGTGVLLREWSQYSNGITSNVELEEVNIIR